MTDQEIFDTLVGVGRQFESQLNMEEIGLMVDLSVLETGVAVWLHAPNCGQCAIGHWMEGYPTTTRAFHLALAERLERSAHFAVGLIIGTDPRNGSRKLHPEEGEDFISGYKLGVKVLAALQPGD